MAQMMSVSYQMIKLLQQQLKIEKYTTTTTTTTTTNNNNNNNNNYNNSDNNNNTFIIIIFLLLLYCHIISYYIIILYYITLYYIMLYYIILYYYIIIIILYIDVKESRCAFARSDYFISFKEINIKITLKIWQIARQQSDLLFIWFYTRYLSWVKE